MAKINFNQIFDGITRALHQAFPEANIHGGVVEQDLQNGDFNVVPITTSHLEQMGKRAQNKPLFDVIYYPTDSGGYTESLRVAHQLAFLLRSIKTPNGDTVHCLSFDTTVEVDALHCTVSYPYFIYTSDVTDPMESLNIE